ncbi:peptidoglycan-binding domain-containing protein [Streptomyces sp. NPDC047072]|uniref:peptidoglycan-binding domain-containing protein n=1 Tax=Streptomyces sp. NPDC047072 TaxID=3154809 RepID=UPI0033C4B178
MAESNGHRCPECGAPRGLDNTPSCACNQRASDALRETREAEAAAAEDFDPLRIRPYVELDGAQPTGDETTPLPRVPQPPAAEETMRIRAVPAPSTTDLNLSAPDADDRTDTDTEPRSRTRRRTVLLGAAAAVVTVVAAAGLASGLFSYETPSRDTAAPQDVRPAVPDTSTNAPSASASPTPESAHPTSEAPSPSADKSPPSSPSPSAKPSSASASASRPAADPSPSVPDKAADAAQESSQDASETAPPVLSRGDKGTEVAELQARLHQLYLYNDTINGVFTTQVEDALRNYQWSRGVSTDNLGVYDAATRARLESETTEP